MNDSSKPRVPAEIAVHRDFPLTSKYDPEWVFDSGMGWPVVWATEALAEMMDLKPGMRVLDLGCGKAASSIFLAREYGVRVWAAELWIPPTRVWERIQAQCLDDLVTPIYAEGHALPFAHGYFDAIVSLGAYHYFGTDDYYLDTIVKFLKPGGQIGIVSPGLVAEFGRSVPDHLAKEYLGGADSWHSFHSPDWWRWHWEKTQLVEIEVADLVPNGWELWLTYDEIIAQLLENFAGDDLAALRLDEGRNIGLTRVVARRKEIQV
ncbi:MAG TPA: methyltransferase domain-containing protein [Armatimonadota bacterium]|nr:methyltransferase domain-containing protein [Armatimonadota bacterium]